MTQASKILKLTRFRRWQWKDVFSVQRKRKMFNQVREINIPNNDANAKYWSLWRWIGISFAMSWWIMGKKGGQFFSSRTIPAAKAGATTSQSDNKSNINQYFNILTWNLITWKRDKINIANQFNLINKINVKLPRCAASSLRFSSYTWHKEINQLLRKFLQRTDLSEFTLYVWFKTMSI